ncbi:telomerase inhibitor [Aspergillus brasiliensis]|uniref:Protein PXR1 n=1 Tax=Aspergillus brasiliensis TaxID=319629 RepID=A0A9W5Z1A2_9EURO|nr:telomerase inhibitor [Aspergillus brasiliensis]GKZ51228.1 telomerase inhibitor [Aspergillus brasiliensis]
MGLAAPRKKIKISHDPNNTNWSRSTSGFGHKILSSQGWTPGSFLGARNAAHAEMFTAASASHIKVILKDDTLGLGARPKRDPLNEPTGLDAFKGLLGRLNGKSDADLQVEQQKRDNAKLARYAATKWQAVTFISGGLLAQEKITPIVIKETPSVDQNKQEDEPSAALPGPDKDRASSDGVQESDNVGGSSDKSIKKKKKSSSKSHREKKDKKRKHTEGFESTDSSNANKKSPEEKREANGDDEGSSSTASKAPSRERRPMGRHVFRGRHIAQKKAALMDEKSLNEIFMVKS